MPAIFPAATKQGGTCFALPDVCKTPAPPGPPVPIPYPNLGSLNQSTKTSRKVKFAGKPVVTLKSEIPRSSGDEAGSAGGVMSGINMGKVTFKQGSTKVIVEGQRCVFLTAVSAQNGANANAPCGVVNAPSQTKVIVSP